jgi:hypothetical protein
MLRGSRVRLCCVVGFPLGAQAPEIKALEARKAIREGAREIDMVINIGALKAAMTPFQATSGGRGAWRRRALQGDPRDGAAHRRGEDPRL